MKENGHQEDHSSSCHFFDYFYRRKITKFFPLILYYRRLFRERSIPKIWARYLGCYKTLIGGLRNFPKILFCFPNLSKENISRNKAKQKFANSDVFGNKPYANPEKIGIIFKFLEGMFPLFDW